jgi:hypothetical protein
MHGQCLQACNLNRTFVHSIRHQFFLPSIAPCVLHVGLTPRFDVDTDSCVVVVPVGVAIAVAVAITMSTGDASVNPDATVWYFMPVTISRGTGLYNELHLD